MSREPPGTARVSWLLAGLALRRWSNRVRAFRAKAKGGRRTATARKSAQSNWILYLLGPLLVFQAITMSSLLVRRLSELGTTAMLAGVGWIVALLAFASFFHGLGGASREFANMEWLFVFPVKTRALLLARVGEHALTDTLVWIAVGPLLLVTYWWSGCGAWGIPLSLGATLGVAAMVGGARLLAGTLLRRRLSRARLRNAAALCTLLGLAFLFLVFWFAISRDLPTVFVALTDVTAVRWSPFGLAVRVADSRLAAAFAFCVVLLAAVCITATARMVRTGLVTGGGAHQGVRGARPVDPGRTRFGGALGKEMLLLRRDRTLAVQSLVTPLFLIGMQAVVNPGLFRSAEGSHAGAIVAFVVACYVLMFGAFAVLAHEKTSLWLLFTLPRSLADLLREKTRIWAAIAMVYGLAVLAYAWRPGQNPSLATWTAPLFALAGVYVYAFVAAGFGCLGTDPFAQTEQRRVRPAWSYLFMLVVSMYAYGLASDSLWGRFVSLLLAVVMAYAIWQKVDERLPLALDPTARPAPRVGLSDGLIAVAAFFHLSAGLSAGLAAGGVASATRIIVAYSVAGSVTAIVTLAILGRLKVPDLRRTLGFTPAPLRVLSKWCLAGAGCAVFAAAYLVVGGRVYAPLRDQLREGLGAGFGLTLLAVVLAPLVEEFIFRGLVFRGMERTLGATRAVFASALLFAIVHPPLSFAPVFLMGVVAATALQRSGSLWSAVGVHATYNLVVVAVLPQMV